jgi:hypothetical protein
VARRHLLVGLTIVALGSSWGWTQTPDPRTAAGQLTVCGGAESWGRIGYLEFVVDVTSPAAKQGPWYYRWDRAHNYLHFSGPGSDGSPLDVVLDIGSRSGGGTKDGAQLTDQPLADAVNWVLTRFSEDVLWLTFPLEWGAPGVTVTPLPNTTGADGVSYLATRVDSAVGSWVVRIDPATGHVVESVFRRPGEPSLTVDWEDWRPDGDVLFAHRRRVEETHEVVEVDVKRALPAAPADAF